MDVIVVTLLLSLLTPLCVFATDVRGMSEESGAREWSLEQDLSGNVSLVDLLYHNLSLSLTQDGNATLTGDNGTSSVAVSGDRPGRASALHSCNWVRAVPDDVRQQLALSSFYSKYTEAYGIPVLSSSKVPEQALRRACYTMRFMMADRRDVREWYYWKRGRVGVMADTEVTLDIPEHSWLPASFNQRARGLGATVTAPITTGAEENLLCYSVVADRYHREDIMLHELAHGIHLLGMTFADASWNRRLSQAYASASRRGLWAGTYANTNVNEYFAEGVQSFFSSNAYKPSPPGNTIDTPEKLEAYDPDLYSLIKEVFPCRNTYADRCGERALFKSQILKMNCDANGEEMHTMPSPTPTMAASTHLPSVSPSPLPPSPPSPSPLPPSSPSPLPPSPSPLPPSPSPLPPSPSLSTTPTAPTTCTDRHHFCSSWSSIGECRRNPAYMLVYCRRSCSVCSGVCHNQHRHCPYWASIGECSKNPNYMLSSCARSCNQC